MTPAEIIMALPILALVVLAVGKALAPRRPAKPAASTTMSYRGRHTRLPPARWRGHQGGGA